jgi:imidazolonepropionase-like amidohydrolase
MPTSSATSTAPRIAAEYAGLSADHLEYTNEAAVARMAASGTVAMLLPAAFYCLRETRLPPIDAFRAARRGDGGGERPESRARRRCCRCGWR